MARSAEAIRRRAEKRNRTEQEQRQSDSKEIDRQLEKEKKQKVPPKEEPLSPTKQQTTNLKAEAAPTSATSTTPTTSIPTNPGESTKLSTETQPPTSSTKRQEQHPQKEEATVKLDPEKESSSTSASASISTGTPSASGPTGTTTTNPLEELGAWKCPSCDNHNFASRHKCRSTTCTQKRPEGVFVPPRRSNPSGSRHDLSTSKKQCWVEQAGEERIANNQDLRKQYLETKGEGMSEQNAARAKLLIERDERKKLKKQTKNKFKGKKEKASGKMKNTKPNE